MASPVRLGPAAKAGKGRAGWPGIALYVALIAYASLYPLTGWHAPREALWSFLTAPFHARLSRSDMLANVLAYIPLGYFLVKRLRVGGADGMGGFAAAFAATVLGAALSLCMEYLQQYLPSRTPSVVDLLTNTLGTLAGACAGLAIHGGTGLAARLRSLRTDLFIAGDAVNGGLLALLIWVLSQLSPFVPSLDVSVIRRGLADLWDTLQDLATLDASVAWVYGLNILGLGLLTATLARRDRPFLPLFGLLVAATLIAKVFIASRQLSLEALCGLAGALVALVILYRLPRRAAAWIALGAICMGFLVTELRPVGGAFLYPFNWVPFASQIGNNVSGFASILGGTWPFIAFASLAQCLRPGWRRARAMAVGAVLVAACTGLLEGLQTYIPGRYGDITVVLLALVGWLTPWCWPVGENRTRTG